MSLSRMMSHMYHPMNSSTSSNSTLLNPFPQCHPSLASVSAPTVPSSTGLLVPPMSLRPGCSTPMHLITPDIGLSSTASGSSNNATTTNRTQQHQQQPHSHVTDSNSCERRQRTSYSKSQLQRLEDIFAKEKYLSKPLRCELAKELNLKESTIKVWFQNKRMKEKRQDCYRRQQAMSLLHIANGDLSLYTKLVETIENHYRHMGGSCQVVPLTHSPPSLGPPSASSGNHNTPPLASTTNGVSGGSRLYHSHTQQQISPSSSSGATAHPSSPGPSPFMLMHNMIMMRNPFAAAPPQESSGSLAPALQHEVSKWLQEPYGGVRPPLGVAFQPSTLAPPLLPLRFPFAAPNGSLLPSGQQTRVFSEEWNPFSSKPDSQRHSSSAASSASSSSSSSGSDKDEEEEIKPSGEGRNLTEHMKVKSTIKTKEEEEEKCNGEEISMLFQPWKDV